MAHAGRREERIPVYSPGRIIWAKDLSKPLNCVLIDVSGSGAKLKVDEPLGADEVVVVHLEMHLLLLEVRYCLARPGTFWVGARRIHSMPAFQVAEDASDAERLRILLADFEQTRRAAAAESVWPPALAGWIATIGGSGVGAKIPAPGPAPEPETAPAPMTEPEPDRFWMPGEPAGWRPAPLGFVAPAGRPVTPDLNARAGELLERLRHLE
jgi:hypothetical protein